MTHLGERLTDFVFGELSAAEMEEARRHVSACGDCRYQAEQLERTRSFLKMSPDLDPPRRILFEFERPSAIWRWLVPVGVAAALFVAVLIAAPIQFQWHDSQLTITVGHGLPPATAGMQPIPPPLQVTPAPQPIDYDRIAKQVESSQQAWLANEMKKHDAEQGRTIGLLQGHMAYVEAQQQGIARDNAENAANIQLIAQRSGAQ